MSTILHINGHATNIDVLSRKGNEIRLMIDGKEYHFIGRSEKDGTFSLDCEASAGQWQRVHGASWRADKSSSRIQIGTAEAKISEHQTQASGNAASQLSPTAPMPGLVRAIMVKKGDKVVEGEALVVFEAMKLQMTLTAGADAVVEDVLVREGQQVAEGSELVKLTAKKK